VHVLLSGVVGSTAYGLAGPDSDVDRLGVFAAPTEAFHGLHFPAESHVTTNPDRTLHECRKAAKLIMGGNPTASEILWLPDELYEIRTELGDELIRIRPAFTCAKRTRDAYLGYATSQFRRLEARGDGSFSADTRKRTAKHARHLYRLCHQGLHLYRTGELLIRLDEPERFRAFGEQVAGGGIGVARRMLAEYEAAFDSARTPLPDRPDEAAVERWLLAVRRAHLSHGVVLDGVR
jgi:predicted nucleotidyltransferase